jgi:hypothetical protein
VFIAVKFIIFRTHDHLALVRPTGFDRETSSDWLTQVDSAIGFAPERDDRASEYIFSQRHVLVGSVLRGDAIALGGGGQS